MLSSGKWESIAYVVYNKTATYLKIDLMQNIKHQITVTFLQNPFIK